MGGDKTLQEIRKKFLFFTSPYSFEGSIIDFSELFSWISENNISAVVLSDSTLHGVVKFLACAKKFEKSIDAYIGYRINDLTFIFTNTDEFYNFISIYNSGKINVSDLKRKFAYFEVQPIYYLPYQREAYDIFCNYLGIPESKRSYGDIRDSILQLALPVPQYDLSADQKLPSSNYDFLDALIKEEQEYPERLQKEIKLIKLFHFEDYFFTIKRIVEIAKANDIEIGPGRGSVVGSLVAYRLGITKINPMEYNLLFERFLNEGRKDYPDIDLDVEDVHRQKLINLLRNEFGYLYNISAFSSIPKKFLETLPQNTKTILEKIPLQRLTHAAGVVISTKPVQVPVVLQTDTLEWDMEDLQSLGYVKFDILGLKTLSIYKELKNNITISQDSEKEKKTYKYISAGFTDNVFQLESPIGKAVVRDVKPSNIKELAMAISLNRPGPLRSGITHEIRNLKLQGKKKYEIPIFEETYGLPLYQEQIMLIAMEIAGFTNTEADALRKAIAKKDTSNKVELFERIKNTFVKKFGKIGEELTRSIIAFGEYAFNKSHAIAYAHLTYYMSYFKINYPTLFYDIYLKHDTSVLSDAIYNLQALGYTISPPKINTLSKRQGEKVYTLPLYVLPGLSYEKSVELQSKNFKNFEDFVEHSGLTLSTIEALLKIGTFDDMFESRRKAIQKLRNLRTGFNPEVAKIGGKLFGKVVKLDDAKVEEDWERTNMEYEILGVALSLPTKVQNKLAPYSLAYCLDLPYGIHISVKAGYGTDGKSVFKLHIPDGDYTLIYPDKFEVGHFNVSYNLKQMPTKSEISKTSNNINAEEIILPDGRSIKNARPIQNNFQTLIKK